MSDDPWKVTSLCNNGHKKSRKGRHGIYYTCGDHCLQKRLQDFLDFRNRITGCAHSLTRLKRSVVVLR